MGDVWYLREPLDRGQAAVKREAGQRPATIVSTSADNGLPAIEKERPTPAPPDMQRKTKLLAREEDLLRKSRLAGAIEDLAGAPFRGMPTLPGPTGYDEGFGGFGGGWGVSGGGFGWGGGWEPWDPFGAWKESHDLPSGGSGRGSEEQKEYGGFWLGEWYDDLEDAWKEWSAIKFWIIGKINDADARGNQSEKDFWWKAYYSWHNCKPGSPMSRDDEPDWYTFLLWLNKEWEKQKAQEAWKATVSGIMPSELPKVQTKEAIRTWMLKQGVTVTGPETAEEPTPQEKWLQLKSWLASHPELQAAMPSADDIVKILEWAGLLAV